MNKLLTNPPGRAPAKDLVEKSNWYNMLDESDKEMVVKIIDQSARIAVFGFLNVLDGSRAIEDGENGILKLYYEKYGRETLLNDPDRPPLHELL